MSSEVAPYDFFTWLHWLPTVALLGFVIWRYAAALREKPSFRKDEIVYQEYMASGSSRRNFLTQFSGARNCLRLVVARDFLWVTSWFPFSLFTPAFDLEHVIPLSSIVSVERARFLWINCLILNFVDQRAQSRSLRLIPKDRERFIAALGAPAL